MLSPLLLIMLKLVFVGNPTQKTVGTEPSQKKPFLPKTSLIELHSRGHGVIPVALFSLFEIWVTEHGKPFRITWLSAIRQKR